ncbi:SAV_2336 N-terminal domain-related protein [Streptomyces sp. NPDC004647]|uniref:SAV_2336 N-terminal domain-related protein n=1 Tax=Streptomyces sp. NPDC004647 TaxID=3154671 RepID=UPI0033ADE853
MAGSGARLAEALRVLSAGGVDLDANQVLDVLWLARRLPSGPRAPLHQDPSAAPHLPVSPPPGPDRTAPEPSPPQADDPDLPDLTSPALYAAARQDPVPPPRATHALSGQESRKAMPVRVPEDKALPGQLELGRVLRPLRRRHDSRHRTEIDEERTAAALAETGLADVVERPVRERWLNLVLVIDDGLSMLLWHRLGAELRTLLERLGAFATSRVLGLDTRSAHQPLLHARPFRPDSAKLPLSTVNDPSGHTLLLVVSDGMGAAWRAGTMHDLLAQQAARGPVAILHTLPPDMWEASGIFAEYWQATTRRVGGANTSWEIIDPVLPPGIAGFDGVPVPVLEPTPASLRRWARLLASPGTTVELPLVAHPGRYATVAPSRDASSTQHFRDAATPEAYRLAAHLAAVSPLSVPVMRLVQKAVPWPATTSQLAEVFLGGLIRPSPAPVPGPFPAKHRIFDFTDESKAVLLDAVPPAELLHTSRRIGRRLEELAGNSPDFPAWLAHPDGPADIPGSRRPFTSVERRLLTRFGVSSTGGTTLPLNRPSRQNGSGADDWEPLTDDDPRRLGGYDLRGRRRGHRTMVYRGVDTRGRNAVLRVPRLDRSAANARLIEVEAEALARLQGQYAPRLLATGFEDSPPWLAMAPIADTDAPNAQPPRLGRILTGALLNGTAPFDLLRGLLVGCYLANALALCHVNGLVPTDLNADSVYVLRRTVALGDLSDCAVDGEYVGSGPAPTREDNVRSLGELLQLISSKAGWDMPSMPEGMHLWQGDTWGPLRQLVLRCLDADAAQRPAASEVAELLARYVARTRLHQADATPSLSPSAAKTSMPVLLTPPPALEASAARHGLRLPRFGTVRREMETRLEKLRVPLPHSRRLTLIGAYHYSGRATTTMVLGSLLASVRGEPVLALDGAASEGSLDAFLTRRNAAVVRDLVALPDAPSYEEIRARTTRLPSGLEVVAHRKGHYTPNPAHAHEYARVLQQTAPYYPFVLTDWAPLRLDGTTGALLDCTDRLILCCGTAHWFVDAAARVLDELRQTGRDGLARDAIVVATDLGGPSGRPLPADPVRNLLVDPAQVVHVPFDAALQSPGWKLNQLRAATVNAFLKLAELVLPSGGAGPGHHRAGP